MDVLGIDIGGSGIKGAIVNTTLGEFASERYRIPTPRPAKPAAVLEAVNQIVRHFNYRGPMGVGFPGVVVDGVVMTAANIHEDWINFPGAARLSEATGCEVTVLNDADAAGTAEMYFGAGRDRRGVVMIFTLGTGIGSVLFVDGRMVPNLELGHVYLPGHGRDAEYYASDRARKKQDLSWKAWAQRLNVYFGHIEMLFSPQLIIIGGGVSKKHKKFLKRLELRAEVVPARLRNQAGIIGAAMAALEHQQVP